jgi:hypothetical protein
LIAQPIYRGALERLEASFRNKDDIIKPHNSLLFSPENDG